MSRHGFRATVFCFCSLLVTAFGVVPSYAISKDFNQTVPLQPCGTFELQNVNGPVDILQLKRAARLQWNRLIEVFADGVTGDDAESGYKKRAKTKNRRAETVP